MPRSLRLAAALMLIPALAAAEAPELSRFEVFFGGLRAGELHLSVQSDGARYAAAAEARAADWVQALYRARLTAEGEGRLDGGGRPERFAVDTRFGGDRQKVTVAWDAAGAPEAVTAEPPWKKRAWEIDPAEQIGAADPMAAALRLLAPRPVQALCNEALEVFDGRRVTRIALGPPEARAGGWRCEGDWQRVAGFRPRDLARPPVPLRVEYAAGPDGTAQAVRLEIDTGWGLAVARRLGPQAE